MSSHKKRKAADQNDGIDLRDKEIAELKAKVASLEQGLVNGKSYQTTLFASEFAQHSPMQVDQIPRFGMNPRHIKELISGIHQLDNKVRCQEILFPRLV